MSDMIIENKVYSQWTSKACAINSRTGELAQRASDINKITTTFNTLIEPPSKEAAAEKRLKVLVSGLCGRGKGRNKLRDLTITLSHLIAIAEAIDRSRDSTSDYALIVIDDTSFTLDISFDELIASAPVGFAML